MRAVSLQPAAGAQGELTGILMIRAYHRAHGRHRARRGPRAGLEPRDEPGDRLDGRLQDGHDPVGRRRRRRRRRVPRGARTADRGGDDHQPIDARAVRVADRRAARRGPRGGRPGLHGRRQPQRHPRAGSSPARPASTSCTSTSTRRSRRRTAAVARARVRSGWGRRCCRTCPSRGSCARTTAAYRLERAGERPTSIGRLRSFVGNTGVLVRAYAYIRAHGGSRPPRGQRRRRPRRQLPASHRLAGTYDIPYDRACKHEFVASAATIKKRTGVRTLDIAKRLIDYGYHPPTIYFPLIVEEGMLIEPTETEIARDAGRLRRRPDRHRRRGGYDPGTRHRSAA